MDATRALLERWVEGWSTSRQVLARREGEGWLVEVAAETRSQEYISTTPSLPELHRLVSVTTRPDVWLTLVGDLDGRSLDAVAALDAVTSDERMMTAPVRPAEVPSIVRIDERGPVAHARIEIEGQVAARGQAALRAGDVVFDRIETTPEFRRRGLGRLIMAGLSDWAAAHNASTGLLMASASGRKLYESLGWSEVAPIVTYRGTKS